MKLIRVCDSDEEYSENKSTMLMVLFKIVPKQELTLFQLRSCETILQVKTMIESMEGVPLERQTLVYDGKVLEDDYETLATCNVKSRSIVHAIFCPPDTTNPKVVGVDMFVKVSCCEPVTVEVKPWYTGQEIKAFVESATGFDLEDYVISHGGRLIDDSKSISKCSVNKKLPIYMVPLGNKKFTIIARGCGWEELILVNELHTVRDVKEKVERFAEVEHNKLELFYGDDDMVYLDDDEKTLGFYKVTKEKSKSTIWVLGCCFKLSIKMPQVGDMIMVSKYRVNSIKDIKHYICEKMGIPCCNQKLFYNGVLLDESDSLEDYNMEGNCVVYAIFGSSNDQVEEIELTYKDLRIQQESGLIELKLQWSNIQESESESESKSESESENESENNHINDIELKSSDTIFDLKSVFESMCGIPICSQQLYCDGKTLKNWEDLKTIRDYNITKLCFIMSPIKLYIRTDNTDDNNNSHLQVVVEAENCFDKIDGILDKLPQEVVENIDGRPCLFLNGTALVGKKLIDYGIQSGSLLCLDSLVQINVTRPNGTVTKVDVNPSFKIKAVKEKIEETCGIPYGLQTLTYGGDQLDDDQLSIGQYEAIFGSLWVLRWKFGRSSWSFFWPSYKDCTTGN